MFTYILIAANVVMFLVETMMGGSTNTDVAIRAGALYSPLVAQGEYWRLFTSMFLHFGMMHLLFNMYALYVAGRNVELVYGKWRFLIIYVGAGLMGNIATMLLSRRAHLSVGASGAVFGLFGALLILAFRPRHGWRIAPGSILTTLGINLVYGFANPQINMRAHVGGLIGGALLALLLG